jgi:hypothetical protein
LAVGECNRRANVRARRSAESARSVCGDGGGGELVGARELRRDSLARDPGSLCIIGIERR